MKHSEIRLGNLVLLNNQKHRPNETGLVHEISGISFNPTKFKEWIGWVVNLKRLENNKFKETYGQFIEFIEPIPLTEEWLIKMGFELSDETLFELNFDSYLSEISLWTRSEMGIMMDVTETKSGHRDCITNRLDHIKHVHQLQNLYFALTGKELTIK